MVRIGDRVICITNAIVFEKKYYLHSESNEKSLVIRDVTSYRGVPYMARKLLKFPVRWRKFPCVNVRKIADA